MSSLVFASCSVTTQSWTIVNMLSLVSASCIVTTHSWPILNFPLLVPFSSWSKFQLVTCSQFQLVVRLYDLFVTFSLYPYSAHFCTAKTRHLRCCIYILDHLSFAQDPPSSAPLCGIRVHSMTVSDTCATHVLDRGKSESCLVKAPAMHASESVLVVGEMLCTSVQANTERDTQETKRAKCAHVGNTNNTPPHANRESGVIQTSNRARVWQIWEARKDT